MNIVQLMTENKEEILEEAIQQLSGMHLRPYEGMGPEWTRQQLEELYALALYCLCVRDAAPMIRRARKVARERFSAGFEFHELQAAVSVLEETIWKTIVSELKPAESAMAIAWISTMLGFARDALERTYVELAANTQMPTLDLKAHFAGGAGANLRARLQ